MKSPRLWERSVGMAALLALSIAPVALGEGTLDPGPTPTSWPGCGGDDPVDWAPYGFANPGDPMYRFGLPDPSTQDLVGFAAKGNVIIGNYLSHEFRNDTLPALYNVRHAYVVDPTDEALGYCSDIFSDTCGTPKPKFDGDYDQRDEDAGTPGRKLDAEGSPRKFYESTLSDEDFAGAINSADPLYNPNAGVSIDGVFFTNHAFAGRVLAASLYMFGSIVARDDGLIRGPWFDLSHDLRLYNELPPGVVMPRDFGRPKLVRWQECTSATPCP